MLLLLSHLPGGTLGPILFWRLLMKHYGHGSPNVLGPTGANHAELHGM